MNCAEEGASIVPEVTHVTKNCRLGSVCSKHVKNGRAQNKGWITQEMKFVSNTQTA